MVNPRLLALALAVSLAAPRAAPAQRLASPMKSWSPSIDAIAHGTTPVTVQATSRDYRIEGTIVGGLLFGALGYWVGHEACKNQRQPTGPNGSDCSTNGLVVGAVVGVVGAGLGYLVGRSVDK